MYITDEAEIVIDAPPEEIWDYDHMNKELVFFKERLESEAHSPTS